MSKNVLHVVPHEQGWAVKREGNERASSTHSTQKEAIESARELAKESDDIVIHRPDGTIRERVTYTGGNNGSQDGRTENGTVVRPRDLMSVGSRVSWGSVAAGVVVAFAIYATLSLLAVAVGVSTIDQVGSQSFTWVAAVTSIVILLGSMFLGGFVVSRTTVGEQPGEAMIYGILVWGAFLMLLIVGGLTAGAGYMSGVRQFSTPATPNMDAAQLQQALDLTPAQAERYAAVARKTQVTTNQTSPQAVAWWTFGGAALSLLVTIGGSLVGAGPQFVVRDLRDRSTATATAVATARGLEPHPA